MALDYGKVRTGIAVTDVLQLIASGLETVPTKGLLPFLKEYVRKESVACIVVGEPRQKDGAPSDIESEIRPFLQQLATTFPKVKIARQDERFTSKMAFDSMISGGLKKKKRQDKSLVDKVSATLILQAYLERVQT